MDLSERTNEAAVERRGFTLIELLVVIAIISVLISMILPALGSTKGAAESLKCKVNLRTLATSQEIYANDNQSLYPKRESPRWPTTLHQYFTSVEVLACPSDSNLDNPPTDPQVTGATTPDQLQRSYFTNGWNDYWEDQGVMTGGNVGTINGRAMNRNVVEGVGGSRVLVFGEAVTDNVGNIHYYMDLLEGAVGNNYDEIAESRHGGRDAVASGTGSANYAFADGHVVGYPWQQSYTPVNQWAVIDSYR